MPLSRLAKLHLSKRGQASGYHFRAVRLTGQERHSLPGSRSLRSPQSSQSDYQPLATPSPYKSFPRYAEATAGSANASTSSSAYANTFKVNGSETLSTYRRLFLKASSSRVDCARLPEELALPNHDPRSVARGIGLTVPVGCRPGRSLGGELKVRARAVPYPHFTAELRFISEPRTKVAVDVRPSLLLDHLG